MSDLKTSACDLHGITYCEECGLADSRWKDHDPVSQTTIPSAEDEAHALVAALQAEDPRNLVEDFVPGQDTLIDGKFDLVRVIQRMRGDRVVTQSTDDDAGVERVARAICRADGAWPDDRAMVRPRSIDDFCRPPRMGLEWENYAPHARAALSVMTTESTP